MRPRLCLSASRVDLAEPACSLPQGSLLSGPHLHAPCEDLTDLALDGSFAEGYARRASEFRVEVLGVAGEDVDDAHVVLLTQQASLRRAGLQQREAFALTVPLGEVADSLALAVGDEAVLDPSPLPETSAPPTAGPSGCGAFPAACPPPQPSATSARTTTG